jgi:hypothetical protein
MTFGYGSGKMPSFCCLYSTGINPIARFFITTSWGPAVGCGAGPIVRSAFSDLSQAAVLGDDIFVDLMKDFGRAGEDNGLEF